MIYFLLRLQHQKLKQVYLYSKVSLCSLVKQRSLKTIIQGADSAVSMLAAQSFVEMSDECNFRDVVISKIVEIPTKEIKTTF